MEHYEAKGIRVNPQNDISDTSVLLVLAGLLLGAGFGLLMGHVLAFTLLGLGAGVVLAALMEVTEGT